MKHHHWLKIYRLKTQNLIALLLCWSVIGLGISWLGLGGYLEQKIGSPILFKIRDTLKQGPIQDERLKIFAIDDRVFAKLGTPMPNEKLWADILDSLVAKKPKVILLDGLFSASTGALDEKTKTLLSQVSQSGVPIVTGAFVTPQPISDRVPLEFSELNYGSLQVTGSPSDEDRLNEDNVFAYGPAKTLRRWFNTYGHIQLFSENKVQLLVQVSSFQLPHISLFAASALDLSHSFLKVDGKPVAVDWGGSVPVNFIPKSSLKVLSMGTLIDQARAGYQSSQVNPGDVVLILPLYFTGNVDLRPSPYGWIPGGHYVAAMVNSVLTGQWLKPVLMSDPLTLLFIGVSVACSMVQTLSLFWLLWASAGLIYFASVQWAFSYLGIVIPFVGPFLVGSLAGIHGFVLRLRSTERSTIALRAALDGVISPEKMSQLVRKAEPISFEPRERVVTLMFIDVVGFSILSENTAPRVVFDQLKQVFTLVSNVIHRYGGIVDKTLGDGLLCYFGYHIESGETDTDHPEKSLRCAIEIQEIMLDECLRLMGTGSPIYPLRIGINTASCFIGDIGSGKRIEITVVGNGVNFAKRLEGACESFKIMIGSTTHDLVKGLMTDNELISQKVIKIKHHRELMDAYEVNPLYHRPEDRERVLEEFRKVTQLQRLNERLPVRDSSRILVETDHGTAILRNFSGGGISIILSSPLSRGTMMVIKLESRMQGLASRLQEIGLESIQGEVRWSYLTAQGFVHGIMFQDLDDEQMVTFHKLMSDYAFIEAQGMGRDNVAS